MSQRRACRKPLRRPADEPREGRRMSGPPDQPCDPGRDKPGREVEPGREAGTFQTKETPDERPSLPRRSASGRRQIMNHTDPARVFISCGQREDGGEFRIAKEIGTRLEGAGFEYYIAIEQQSLLAIRENVFPRLTDYEYFLFIDFRRERLGRSGPYRGSLFSHQELAIASYLEKDLIAFRENGVSPLDGLIGHLQANCTAFTDRSTLPDLVIEEVKRRHWTPDWRNELVISLNDPPYDDARAVPENVYGRFFHLRVLTATGPVQPETA
jgi:hypothetical protein